MHLASGTPQNPMGTYHNITLTRENLVNNTTIINTGSDYNSLQIIDAIINVGVEVDTQVQILTDNFLLALDSCAPFEVKLIKRPPARWITETIKNEINKKYILSHEYKSIVDNAGKLQKETEYKQQKMMFIS